MKTVIFIHKVKIIETSIFTYYYYRIMKNLSTVVLINI